MIDEGQMRWARMGILGGWVALGLALAPARGQEAPDHGLGAATSLQAVVASDGAVGVRGRGLDEVDSLTLRTTGLWFDGERLGLSAAPDLRRGARLELDHGALVEWYTVHPKGLEQGWDVAQAPSSPAQEMRIVVEVRGLEVRGPRGTDALEFIDGSGQVRIDYTGLRAGDAEGRGLPARLERGGDGFVVVVDIAGARFPVTVDPVLSAPVWTAESNQAVSFYADNLAMVGDVNGDGFDDAVVSAYFFSSGQNREGKAFAYYGSPAGPSAVADWTAESDVADANFGRVLGAAGDVNGDGFDDLLISAPAFGGTFGDGRLSLYFGSASGLENTPGWFLDGTFTGACVGGDVNGDGFDDVLVGEPRFAQGQANEGRVVAYLGSASGPGTTPAWSVEGEAVDRFLGSGLAVGDVNGDGFDDVVAVSRAFLGGSDFQGSAALFLGAASGPGTVPAWSVTSPQINAFFAQSLSAGGDVNGDGFDDIALGAWNWDEPSANGSGAVFVYLGAAGGPALAADWSRTGAETGDGLGSAVSLSGDVNGDGFDDLAVGARFQGDAGRSYVHLGSGSGLSRTSAWDFGLSQFAASYGKALDLGDANGDGFADLLAGAPGLDAPQNNEGRAYCHLGAPSEDCNGNGVDDGVDLSSGTSVDGNDNLIPDECDCTIESYCVANPNSAGATALLSGMGSTSLADGDFSVAVSGAVPARTGLFFLGSTRSMIPFGDGLRCVRSGPSGNIARLQPPVVLGSQGTAVRTLDFASYPADGFLPFQEVDFQFWYRDAAAGGAGFNLSDALAVVFCP